MDKGQDRFGVQTSGRIASYGDRMGRPVPARQARAAEDDSFTSWMLTGGGVTWLMGSTIAVVLLLALQGHPAVGMNPASFHQCVQLEGDRNLCWVRAR